MNPVFSEQHSLQDFWWRPLRYRWRWVLALAAFVGAVAHVPILGEHLREAPYMGVEFLVLIVGCLLIGAGALICDSRALYVVATVACGLAIAGYAATRLVAFPDLADDVGNWWEPLGVVSIAAEIVVVAIAMAALACARRSTR